MLRDIAIGIECKKHKMCSWQGDTCPFKRNEPDRSSGYLCSEYEVDEKYTAIVDQILVKLGYTDIDEWKEEADPSDWLKLIGDEYVN